MSNPRKKNHKLRPLRDIPTLGAANGKETGRKILAGVPRPISCDNISVARLVKGEKNDYQINP